MHLAITLVLSLIFTALPALADSPQISRSLRIYMLPGALYDEKIKSSPRTTWSFWVPKQLDVLDPQMTSTHEGQPFSSTVELIGFFEKLPLPIQEQGIWLTFMGIQRETQFDMDRLSELRSWGRQRNTPIYVCKPMKPTTSSIHVAWHCDMFNARNEPIKIFCEPEKTPSPKGSPVWKCLAPRSEIEPKPPL